MKLYGDSTALNKPDGVILNLDADCLVEKNYFVSVYNEFFNKKERSACSIYFEHPFQGDDFPEEVYRYITLYELHLRYYFQGLLLYRISLMFFIQSDQQSAVKALALCKSRRDEQEDRPERIFILFRSLFLPEDISVLIPLRFILHPDPHSGCHSVQELQSARLTGSGEAMSSDI